MGWRIDRARWSFLLPGVLALLLVAAAAAGPVGGVSSTTARRPTVVPAAYNWRVWQNWKSQKCMGVAGGKMSNGTKIIQWTCNGNPDQLWNAFPIGPNGTPDMVQFRNYANPGKCLGAPGGVLTPGVQFIIWDC